MTESPVRVAVVDDYEIVAAGVAAVLSAFRDRVAVVEIDSNLPVLSDVDVVLYDSFAQPQGPRIDIAQLRAGSAKIVVFSWNTDPDVVRQSLDTGVDGYISKGVSAKVSSTPSGEYVRVSWSPPRSRVSQTATGSGPGRETSTA